MRKTKIICTLGPATDSPEKLRALITAGANVFRLNMSHAPHDWVRQVVKDIRAISAELGVITAIAYIALWIAALISAARLSRASWIGAAAFLMIVAMAVRNMGDYMFFSTGGTQARLHTLLWLVWGVVGGYRFASAPATTSIPTAADLEAVKA